MYLEVNLLTLGTSFKEISTNQYSHGFHQYPARMHPEIARRIIHKYASDSKKIDAAANEISLISGQKPVVIKSRKSVATFKLREGMSVGCKVTLRRDRMYEFMDRLINIALPQVRDFRGLSPKSFDGRGNYALGLKEQIVFPEIDYDTVDEMRGMDIVIVTSAKTNDEAKALLKGLNLPIN